MKAPIPLTPDATSARRNDPLGWTSKTLNLVTLTPIYGGGVKARELGPESEPIRVSSIRGHLRSWWRARHALAFETPEALYQAERDLWGGVGRRPQDVRACRVRLHLELEPKSVQQDKGQMDFRHPDGYVLWPAGPDRIPRWAPGIRFRLTVRYPTGDEGVEEIVKVVLRDWVLFGGVGGRTRRGCGAVGLTEPAHRMWLSLPTAADALTGLGGANGAQGAPAALNIGALRGAIAVTRPAVPATDALSAWRTAHGWLKDFRQGAKDAVDKASPGIHARERPTYAGGHNPREHRPGRSRWPEPDKIRLAFAVPPSGWAHTPRTGIGAQPAWPRASFGLPIQVKFQTTPRPSQTYPHPAEPAGPGPGGTHIFKWRVGATGELIERLPSPLIVKPMQLADGRFVSLALWLSRSLPQGAEVGLVDGDTLKATTAAQFDTLRGPGDTDYFRPLVGKTTTRDAFLDWLTAKPGNTRYTL